MNKTRFARENAQLADVKQLLCSPLARGESCEQDSFLFNRKDRLRRSLELKMPA